jgi:pyridoxine/pyridoxamine 5'-phosphate oxidase
MASEHTAAGGRKVSVQGAANLVSTRTAASTAAATLVAARPTRRRVVIKNLDATITVYVGPATVTAANGMELKAGESLVLTWVGLIQVIAASGTPAVHTCDEWD